MKTARTGGHALIFDMDGVLIDSEPLWRRAEIEIFGEVGLVLTEADCLQTQGQRIDEAVAYWYARSPWAGRSCENIVESVVTKMSELIRSEGEPMRGALAAIEWAATSPWRLALASSSSKFLIETVLDHLDMADRFECRRSAEDEKSGKPHPDVYLSVARELAVDPVGCIAIEDSINGVLSAMSAGMRCIAIPPPETREDARFEAATMRLDSLRGLPEAITALCEGSPGPV